MMAPSPESRSAAEAGNIDDSVVLFHWIMEQQQRCTAASTVGVVVVEKMQVGVLIGKETYPLDGLLLLLMLISATSCPSPLVGWAWDADHVCTLDWPVIDGVMLGNLCMHYVVCGNKKLLKPFFVGQQSQQTLFIIYLFQTRFDSDICELAIKVTALSSCVLAFYWNALAFINLCKCTPIHCFNKSNF